MTAESHAIQPPLDPEVGPTWREISATLFDGRGPRVVAETLDVARELSFPTRAELLARHPYDEVTVHAPGPAGTIPVSVLTPIGHDQASPAVFWIHGGGMVSGNRFSAEEAMDVAACVGAVVASPEYRLAPEHPSPAPGDDCVAALRWFIDHAEAYGVDARRVVLAGASAGGGLAAATALRTRDEGGPRLAGLLLCDPMLDDRMTTWSSRQLADGGMWTRESNEFGWRSLLGDRSGGDAVSAYEAPARATDLSGLPPVLIDVGSADLFRDEDVEFASRIWAAGGDCELHVWPGGYHGFELMVPTAAISKDAYHARRRWLARVLARLDPT